MTEILNTFDFGGGIQPLAALLILITLLALVCSLVVEAVKELPGVGGIPTKLVCYIVAVALTTPSFVAMMAYLKIPVEWYMCFASFLASFVVAKVAMGGWDDVTEIYRRMAGKE